MDLKPLIPIAGEPMVRRPVRALLSSKRIGRVVLLSQQPERIADAVPGDKRLLVRASDDTIASTMLAMCFDRETQWPLLVTTADHALLDGAIIDEFCAGAEGSDIAVGVVERATLERRFPQAKRTWIPFRGGAYSGANLFALASPRAAAAIEMWRSVEQDRKKGWRVLSLLGPMVLVGTILRLLTIDAVLARVGRRLGLTVKAVVLGNPLAAIDVDKPEDHALVEDIVAGRA
jgi:GTP:adenosylcobinamide-phosphate guanylyltransferase